MDMRLLLTYVVLVAIVCLVTYLLKRVRNFVQDRIQQKKDEMLRGMTVRELLDSDLFKKELQLQIKLETEEHNKMLGEAMVRGMNLQRCPYDRLKERGIFNVEDLTEAYKFIVGKQLKEFSAAEREYIKRVVMMAYWRVVEKMKYKGKDKA